MLVLEAIFLEELWEAMIYCWMSYFQVYKNGIESIFSKMVSIFNLTILKLNISCNIFHCWLYYYDFDFIILVIIIVIIIIIIMVIGYSSPWQSQPASQTTESVRTARAGDALQRLRVRSYSDTHSDHHDHHHTHHDHYDPQQQPANIIWCVCSHCDGLHCWDWIGPQRCPEVCWGFEIFW